MTEFWFVPEIHKSQGWPRFKKRRDLYLPKKVPLRIGNSATPIRSYFDSRWNFFKNEHSLRMTSKQKEAELIVIEGPKHMYGKLIAFDDDLNSMISRLAGCVVMMARNYRGYGNFRCNPGQTFGGLCNEWGSPHAFRGTFQMCKNCSKKVFSQDRKKRIKPSQHSRKKHLSKLCERCVSGKHCMSNKVHAKTGYDQS